MNLTGEESRSLPSATGAGALRCREYQQNQLIFALAELGEATAAQVAAEVKQLQGRDLDEQQQAFIPVTLKALFDKGLLNGTEQGGAIVYNLHKITPGQRRRY